MTIAVKMLNDQIKKISDTNTLLDMLLEFEKVLEDIDVYAYKNWAKGEVLEGPKLSRHYVTVTLVYPQKEMPDPEGAKRLMARDCLVKYHQDELISPVKVRSFDDISTDITPDGQTKHKAKTKSENVWVVEVKMPRRYVDEFSTEVVEADEDLYVDTESFNTEQVASAETQVTGGNDGA
jgi:hypothetical protein